MQLASPLRPRRVLRLTPYLDGEPLSQAEVEALQAGIITRSIDQDANEGSASREQSAHEVMEDQDEDFNYAVNKFTVTSLAESSLLEAIASTCSSLQIGFRGLVWKDPGVDQDVLEHYIWRQVLDDFPVTGAGFVSFPPTGSFRSTLRGTHGKSRYGLPGISVADRDLVRLESPVWVRICCGG